MGNDTQGDRLFELVYFRIYDVGRAVNLDQLTGGAHGAPAGEEPGPSAGSARRDTPASLSLPVPYRYGLAPADSAVLGRIEAEAKVYEDGAITVCLRATCRTSLEGLGDAAAGPIVRTKTGALRLSAWADEAFAGVLGRIRDRVVDLAADPGKDFETYLAFCLLECDEGPEAYIAEHRTAVATLLMGADPGDAVHEQKIAETLAKPFSYTVADIAVFDLDRCFIVDPQRGYEDILLIIEHANYRLLELRTLDRLLDKRLDVAERDLGSFTRRGRAPVGAVRKKFARIQALRFVALFVLENLENSSKIIGDYYLGQIYGRLCALFNTDEWSRSVERRLDVLTSVYEMVKTDNAERRTLILEIVFIAVCIILPVIQIWQALL